MTIPSIDVAIGLKRVLSRMSEILLKEDVICILSEKGIGNRERSKKTRDLMALEAGMWMPRGEKEWCRIHVPGLRHISRVARASLV